MQIYLTNYTVAMGFVPEIKYFVKYFVSGDYTQKTSKALAGI